jgi:hypothetical protein
MENLITLSPETLVLIRGLLKEEMTTISCWEQTPRLTRDVLEAAFRFSESFLERPLKSRRVVFQYLDRNEDTI